MSTTSQVSHAPSLFNDVIGPVMRGASSSHGAAALRIGRLARSLMGNRIDRVRVEFERSGALATTHESQGSDMGLFGGLLGWELTDERLLDYQQHMDASGIAVEIELTEFEAPSPNIYKLTLESADGRHELVADSTGGGMIEVLSIDGVPLSLAGDCHATLVFPRGDGAALRDRLAVLARRGEARVLGEGRLVELRDEAFLEPAARAELEREFAVEHWLELAPVLPVWTHPDLALPFTSCAEMLACEGTAGRPLWERALDYECARGSLERAEVFARMAEIVRLLEGSVQQGLAGTEYADRILGVQCAPFRDKMQAGGLIELGLLNEIILQITALMEVKSSMGVIVAAPTAGACGAVPGSVLGAAKVLGLDEDTRTRGLLTAGLIGTFIATRSTFAAEKAGCQAECGAGSGMAAAALVEMAGGTPEQGLAAASMALQNMLGLICDPVAKRVEVPCLGRNVLAASNALSCANMALAGYDQVIPLDEVIEAMDGIGRGMPCELRCTGLGGLSVTPTSLRIEEDLGCGGCA